MTGRELMEAMAEGRVPPPPIAVALGFSMLEIGDGEVRFGLTPDESHYNPGGVVHGGVVATLLDTVVGCAVHTTLPAGVGYASIELKVSFLRAIDAGTGPMVAHGRVTKPGRRVAFAEGDLRDADGKLLATASSSLLILEPARP